jgi:hypothetical protein
VYFRFAFFAIHNPSDLSYECQASSTSDIWSALSTWRIATSKVQKGNKENKKADKNRVKSVSAYKAAQSLGKPAISQFGKKT